MLKFSYFYFVLRYFLVILLVPGLVFTVITLVLIAHVERKTWKSPGQYLSNPPDEIQLLYAVCLLTELCVLHTDEIPEQLMINVC